MEYIGRCESVVTLRGTSSSPGIVWRVLRWRCVCDAIKNNISTHAVFTRKQCGAVVQMARALHNFW